MCRGLLHLGVVEFGELCLCDIEPETTFPSSPEAPEQVPLAPEQVAQSSKPVPQGQEVVLRQARARSRSRERSDVPGQVILPLEQTMPADKEEEDEVTVSRKRASEKGAQVPFFKLGCYKR